MAEREKYKQTTKTKFCSFISSHPVPHRNRFVSQLMARKKIDCVGYCLNNTEQNLGAGLGATEKIEFMSRYKFNVCFEHTSYPSYITEKIYNALHAATVPIYFGAADIAADINPSAFIDVNSFPSNQAAIDYIIELDQNPELYESYLQADPFTPDSLFLHDSVTNIEKFYTSVIEEVADLSPTAPPFGTRLYRHCYALISFLHLLVTHHHVDGLPLHQLLLDWRNLLRAPLTVVEKLWHRRNRKKHYAMKF